MTPTAHLLAVVAAKIGKPPHEVWPGWYKEKAVCPKCRKRHTVMTTYEGGVFWCAGCDGEKGFGKRVPESHFPLALCYSGPDLYAPQNLHLLFEVADLLCDGYCEIMASDGAVPMTFIARIWPDGFGPFESVGSTRSAALAAAILATCGEEGK